MVEHHNGIVGVRGSNPLGSTILIMAGYAPDNFPACRLLLSGALQFDRRWKNQPD